MLFKGCDIRYQSIRQKHEQFMGLRFTSTVLAATLILSGCGAVRDSRVNPLNWFGNSQSAPVEQQEQVETNPLIPQDESRGLFSRLRADVVAYTGQPVDQVSALVIEAVPGGAIVRASGVADYDFPYDVQLTPATDDARPVDGVLTYRLEAERPRNPRLRTSARVRTVTAAIRLTDQDLAGVNVIRVEGARNVQSTTRR